MASLAPSSPALTLLALPVEIHAAILSHLPFLDLQTLRLTNHYFYAMLPPPTHAELVWAEMLDFAFLAFLACVGCTRLRPMDAFSSKMLRKKKVPGGTKAHNRFCIECGRRPLPGPYRYLLGSRWKEHGVPFARCLKCREVAIGPEDQAVPLCFSCHTEEVEGSAGTSVGLGTG